MTAEKTDRPVSRHISGMNRSACVFALILGLAACNDPTNIGEQETDGASGTGEQDSSSGGTGPSASGSASGSSGTTDNPSASSQGSSSATSAGPESSATGESTDGDTTGESGSEETGQIQPPDGSNVIYLNFGGVTLSAGADNAPANTTAVGIDGELSPYQFPDDVPGIVATVEAAWSGINVVFVTERPADGDFTMLVITPTNPLGAGVAGIAPLDCGYTNPNSIGAAFTNTVADAATVASVISRELGYTYGLENTDADTDFMNGNFMFGTEFVDACIDTVAQPSACIHEGCAGGQVNTYGELLSRLAAE